MHRFRLGWIGVGAAAAGIMAAATTTRADITIAINTAITGQYATFGEQMQRGAALAVADLNAAGGVLGQPLRLIVGDDACDPHQAVSIAHQTAREGAVFVAGHFCSGASIPASHVYTEKGILQISPASTNPKLTDEAKGPNVFRLRGRDDQYAALAAQYIAQNYRGRRIAILHDNSVYGKDLADATKAALNAAGLTEAVYEAYTAGESDYSALVSQLKQENIDVVYLGGYHTEAGLILRQLREQGSQAQFISGPGLVTTEFWSITGPAGEGTLFTFGPDPRTVPAAAAVVQRFRAAGYEPEGYTLYTYAAVQVFAEAARQAGSTDLAKLINALHSTTFQTVIGPISFDQKGDIREPGYIYRWHDGSFARVN